MARNTGRGSRAASGAAARFQRAKAIGGLFGWRPTLWQRLTSSNARKAHRAIKRAER